MANYNKYMRSAKKLKTMKDRKALLDKKAKELGTQIGTVKEEMVDMAINLGIPSVRLAELGTISLVKKEFPKIKDVASFFEYLESKGEGDMIKKTVAAQTLRGWWNAIEEKNRPDIDEIGLEIYSEYDISIRKT